MSTACSVIEQGGRDQVTGGGYQRLCCCGMRQELPWAVPPVPRVMGPSVQQDGNKEQVLQMLVLTLGVEQGKLFSSVTNSPA